jgi:uncharacterized protein with HEPN domain
MSERPVDILLLDILEAIDRIEAYAAGHDLTTFLDDRRTQDAVVRNLEIIGEASNRLPAAFRRKHAEITWDRIIGLRHRIVHEYFGIDLALVWSIIQGDLPALKTALQALVD